MIKDKSSSIEVIQFVHKVVNEHLIDMGANYKQIPVDETCEKLIKYFTEQIPRVIRNVKEESAKEKEMLKNPSWRDVLDVTRASSFDINHIGGAAIQARMLGYKYFLWNGWVYRGDLSSKSRDNDRLWKEEDVK